MNRILRYVAGIACGVLMLLTVSLVLPTSEASAEAIRLQQTQDRCFSCVTVCGELLSCICNAAFVPGCDC